jgi:hypothetical protein
MDIDDCKETETFVNKYFTDNVSYSIYGESGTSKELFGEWFDSRKAGFSDSVHQIKDIEVNKENGFVTVSIVWTAKLKNIDIGNNSVRYPSKAIIELQKDRDSFKIEKYRIIAVN